MAKDPRLINIYLKIHNKRSLTMDDLQYLALYSPECFEKTCKNVIYNYPSAKPIMEPENVTESNFTLLTEEENITTVDIYTTEQNKIQKVLEKLRKLDKADMPQTGVNIKVVKNLLGNLFMELIFPHDDKTITLHTPESFSSVDFRV